jgi:cytochrome bd ubiquinol oxidase subunit I
LVYLCVFAMGIYYINRLIEHGPSGAAAATPEALPSRPLAAASEAAHEAMED